MVDWCDGLSAHIRSLARNINTVDGRALEAARSARGSPSTDSPHRQSAQSARTITRSSVPMSGPGMSACAPRMGTIAPTSLRVSLCSSRADSWVGSCFICFVLFWNGGVLSLVCFFIGVFCVFKAATCRFGERFEFARYVFV